MISPGEWDDAVKVRFGANLPASAGGGTVAAEIMAMSDADNLYVAYRYDRDTTAFGQSHTVEVDANHSGGPDDGDDAWLFTPGIGFFDDYRGPCLVSGTLQSCAAQDTTDTGFGVPGTNDGGAAIAFSPDRTVVEMWHPYHDGDLRDAQGKPGDSLPMSFFVRLLDSCPDFPRCYGDTWFPGTFQYRPFLLACGAPPPPPGDDGDEDIIEVHIDVAPGDPLPTIHLGAAGTTPVAVLGSGRFDVTRVNPASVFFAGAPVVVDQGVPRMSVQDVNGDGTPDLVAEFETSALQLKVGDTSASLAGKTRAGRRFHGTDGVRVLP